MSAQVFDFDAPLPGLLYWDASFLVHATYPAGRYHQACYGFLDRLSGTEGTLSCVSTLALDETVFTLIRLKVIEGHPDRVSGTSIAKTRKSSCPIWARSEHWWIVCR